MNTTLGILVPAFLCCLKLSAQQPEIVYAKQKDGFQVKFENPTKLLGIGLLKLGYEREINFYEDPGLSRPAATWIIEEPTEKIYPKYYEIDYGICEFILLEQGPGYFKVLVGYETEWYVKRDDNWIVESWQNRISGSYGVTRKRDKRAENKLRVKADDNSQEINIELKVHENFCVIAVEGEWLKVQYDCIYASEQYMTEFEGMPCSSYIQECGSEKIGWLRWQKDDVLLIDIYLQP